MNDHCDLVCLVSNDLTYDQRMKRTCDFLASKGLKVILIGRQLPESSELKKCSYDQYRVNCWINSGPFFYFELIIRLWLKIRKISFSKLLCVDLDTVLISRLLYKENRKYYLDLHEYFEEVPELDGGEYKKFIWRKVGEYCVPHFDKCYTVNKSLSEIFSKKYKSQFEYVRNIPDVNESFIKREFKQTLNTAYLGVLNPGRGLENIIEIIGPMNRVNLKIIGDGPLMTKLKLLAANYSNIRFTGKLDLEEIDSELKEVHLGWNLLDPNSKSYYYSLGNKVFDYMLRGMPFVTMNFPEYQALHKNNPCGILINDINSETVRSVINELLDKPEKWHKMHESCLLSCENYNWNKESEKLISIFDCHSSNSPL